jgi:hypothetical protein
VDEETDVTTYRDGTQSQSKRCKSIDLKTGAWCYYTKDDGTTDGLTRKLYNWYAVMGIAVCKEDATPQPHK